ncbi:MAG: tyrosine recombinase XerC [Oscillospiraceae bacterium]|nr:tyrosine recombinase XerC [Oscillospiraceae bacterium]
MSDINLFSDVSPLIKKFLFYMLTIKGRSKNTVKSYYFDLKLFFRFLKIFYKQESLENFDEINIKDIDLNFIKKIKTADIFEFLFFLANSRKNENKTRARKVSCLKSFFKYFYNNEKVLDENPVDGLDSPKIKKSLPKYLDLDQSQLLLSNVDGAHKERDYLILTLFLNCGLRLSELISLNLEDIKNNPIKITGKGNKERQIYLNQITVRALDEYLKIRTKIKTDSPALFLSQNKTRISNRRVQKIVEENLEKNNLIGFSVHKLRHTAATLMFQYGEVDVRTLQEILGHESLSTTQIYTHVSNSQIQEAFESNPLNKINKKLKN